jgi:hypothetical protein
VVNWITFPTAAELVVVTVVFCVPQLDHERVFGLTVPLPEATMEPKMPLEILRKSFAFKPAIEMFSNVNDCELRTSNGCEYLPKLKGCSIIGKVPLIVSVMFPLPVPLRVPVTLVEPPSGTVVFSIEQLA